MDLYATKQKLFDGDTFDAFSSISMLKQRKASEKASVFVK